MRGRSGRERERGEGDALLFIDPHSVLSLIWVLVSLLLKILHLSEPKTGVMSGLCVNT